MLIHRLIEVKRHSLLPVLWNTRPEQGCICPYAFIHHKLHNWWWNYAAPYAGAGARKGL